MPPAKTTYILPTDAPPSVLKEDGIEYGFIDKLQRIKSGNGFDRHTTCSSKTLTSSKASNLLKENDSILNYVFVVDRKHLDRQKREDWSSIDKTSSEGEARRGSACSVNQFNRFHEGCFEENTNTAALV